MKKGIKTKVLLAMSLMGIAVANGVSSKSVSAATYAIEITGGTYEIEASQIKAGMDVSFTFKADESKYKGVIGADYVLQYDPVRMDLPTELVKQEAVLVANPDFDFNDGTPGAKGMLWMSMSNVLPSQNYDLKMKATNLFKDGKRTPITIKVITDHEDNIFAVNDEKTVIDSANVHSTPITIKLKDIVVTMNTANSIKVGTEKTYSATVSNTLNDNGVNWTIEGAKDAGTKIDNNGKVTVAATEKATSINVIATSKEDNTKKASQTVNITTGEVPVDPINPANPNNPTTPEIKPTPETKPGQNGTTKTTTKEDSKKVVATNDGAMIGIYALGLSLTGFGAFQLMRRKNKQEQ